MYLQRHLLNLLLTFIKHSYMYMLRTTSTESIARIRVTSETKSSHFLTLSQDLPGLSIRQETLGSSLLVLRIIL